MPMARALFLDRDGVINVDHGYIDAIERFDVIPGVFEALARARDCGFLLVVVTNQSGIARGYFSAADYDSIERHMIAQFEASGIRFAGIYHCPHHIDGLGSLAVECDCRKPAPGLILQACADLAIDPSRSIMIGDRASDLQAGEAAGIPNCFLIDGIGDQHERFVSLFDFITSRTFETIARMPLPNDAAAE